MFSQQRKWLIFEENGTFEGIFTKFDASSYLEAQNKIEQLSKETGKNYFITMHRDENIDIVFAKIKRLINELMVFYKYCGEEKQKEIIKFINGCEDELHELEKEFRSVQAGY